RQMIDRAERMLDWDHMIRAIERTAPIHQPGERSGYHGLTYGFLVGEIIRRVTAKPFSQVVQDEIARPLRLDGLFVGAPDDVLGPAAQLMRPTSGWLKQYGPQLGDALERGALAGRWLLRLCGLDLELAGALDALAPRGISSFDFSAHETLR